MELKSEFDKQQVLKDLIFQQILQQPDLRKMTVVVLQDTMS